MSPYLPFALIERNQLKRVTDDSTLFSSFITDIQSYISILSAYFAIFPKFPGKPALIFGTIQYHEFTDSLASSIRDVLRGLLPSSSESIPWAYWFGFMNFRKSASISDCRLTPEPAIYYGSGTISSNIPKHNYISKTPTTII